MPFLLRCSSVGALADFPLFLSTRLPFRFGQTNCFVGVNITYGLFQATPTDVYLISERSAKNMSFQGLFEVEGQLNKLGEIKGVDVVGTKIKAPLSIYDEVWVLPMDGVLATKVRPSLCSSFLVSSEAHPSVLSAFSRG